MLTYRNDHNIAPSLEPAPLSKVPSLFPNSQLLFWISATSLLPPIVFTMLHIHITWFNWSVGVLHVCHFFAFSDSFFDAMLYGLFYEEIDWCSFVKLASLTFCMGVSNILSFASSSKFSLDSCYLLGGRLADNDATSLKRLSFIGNVCF